MPPNDSSTGDLTPTMAEAICLLASAPAPGEGSLTIDATQAECAGGMVPGWAWINHGTGRALARRGLAVTEERSVLDGPDEIELTEAGWEAARALVL